MVIKLLRAFLRPLALSTVVVLPAAAQMMGRCDTTTGPILASTSFGIGAQGLDVAGLNALLGASGFPKLSATGLSSSFSTEIRVGRWALLFSGGGISGSRQESASWRTQGGGSVFLFGTGYALVHSRRWRVVPAAGAGWSRMKYHLEQVRGGSLDSAVADPLRGTDLEGQSPIWSGELRVERNFSRRPNRYLAATLRLGYVGRFGTTDWRADENDLSGGTNSGYQGLHIELGMAFGMSRRRDALLPALASVIPWIGRRG